MNKMLNYVFNESLRIYERSDATRFGYSDGDSVEKRIYQAIKTSSDVSLASNELAGHIKDWPSMYHLTPVRSNVLRPLETVLQGKRVLELGSGCGAISRFLAEAGALLTCVEGSRRRAAITAERTRDFQSVRVFNDNFQDFCCEEKFDVVTMIGVLEYSRAFISGEDPVAQALALASDFLKPDGMLVVAIENKLGLKYWAGAPEDHIGVPFFGLEGLYGSKTAVTFGRKELKNILIDNGFPDVEFFYPYPDYKLPSTILSEQIESHDPAIAINLLSSMFAPNQARDYGRTFSEGAVYRSIIENGLLGDMANSFLVLAKKESNTWPVEENTLAFVYSSGRTARLTKEIKLQCTGDDIHVTRRMLYRQHERTSLLFPSEEPLKSGELLFNSLLPIINRAGWSASDIACWYRPLYEHLLSLSSLEEDGSRSLQAFYLDASPFNFIGDDTYELFDLEWDAGEPLELWYPVFRGLYYSLSKIGTVAPPAANVPLKIVDLVQGIIEMLGGVDVEATALIAREVAFLEKELDRKVSVEAICNTTLRIRGAEASVRAEMPTVENSLENWLDMRAPKENALRLINKTLAQHNSITFTIFVHDSAGDLNAVISTISSLDADRNFYENTRIVVLTPLDIPAENSSSELRFIRVPAGGLVEALNQLVVDLVDSWFIVVRAGDEFTAVGLQTLALELLGVENCRAVYGDSLYRNQGGGFEVSFRPAFNLDYLLSYPAEMSRHWFFHRDAFLQLDGFDPQFAGAFILDYILRLAEVGGLHDLAHVDEPIIVCDQALTKSPEQEKSVIGNHLVRRGYEASHISDIDVGVYRINYGHEDRPLVSLVLPLISSLTKLQVALESLLTLTEYDCYEVVLVASSATDEASMSWVGELVSVSAGRIRVLRFEGRPNNVAMLNAGAADSNGEFLVFLGNDVEFIEPDWLAEMLNHGQRPEVGVVGAKVFYLTGEVKHAGIVLGLRGPAGGAFVGAPGEAYGYMNRLRVAQNYSAVSRSCMMVSRELFTEVGGFDSEQLTSEFAEVDFCLKVKTAGQMVVWTPFARIRQGLQTDTVEQQERSQEEIDSERQAMYERWLPQLAHDPAYNQNLSLAGTGFAPDYSKEREWRHIGPAVLPRILCHPSDSGGCGHYRLHQPFVAMERDLLAEGMSTSKLLAPVELERFAPDTIVYQRQFTPHSLLLREESNIYKGVFRVMDMDDFIPGVPPKSIHYKQIPKDVMTYINKSLSLVDRFVVSTEPLAEAFAGLHPDIRVMQNRLPVEWWGNLESARRVGRKPRVGWAGGTSHTGDLELLVDVVRQLANEVEWVFFGMCPDQLRPYIHEFHGGLHIEKYPARLASMNLDLALAPLEMNLFNECKSNLRLLEYGACGFPVICTDIITYRCGMPVTMVKNRTEEWVDAIRMHLSDLDATAKMGDELRETVLSHWMLKADAVEGWRKAWLPD